ncbi:MAG: hypothetical protein M3N08_03085 [Pseudomonadota bacterium]|nr:hypothetical protein [Pseudomonadota bacterium]
MAFPIQLTVNDFYQASREVLRLERTPEMPALMQTRRLSRPIPVSAGDLQDVSARGSPLYIEYETRTRWAEARKTGKDQYRLRELEIRHSFSARPTERPSVFIDNLVDRDTAVQQLADWEKQASAQRLWAERVTRPPPATPWHFSRARRGFDGPARGAR